MSLHPIKGAVIWIAVTMKACIISLAESPKREVRRLPDSLYMADAGTELVGGEAMLRICMEPHASGFRLTIENDEFKIVISYRCTICLGI